MHIIMQGVFHGAIKTCKATLKYPHCTVNGLENDMRTWKWNESHCLIIFSEFSVVAYRTPNQPHNWDSVKRL